MPKELAYPEVVVRPTLEHGPRRKDHWPLATGPARPEVGNLGGGIGYWPMGSRSDPLAIRGKNRKKGQKFGPPP